jgi:hypothetical protein
MSYLATLVNYRADEHRPMRHDTAMPPGLTDIQIEQFIKEGYVRIDNAFPKGLATQGRARMWRDINADPNDPSTWKGPVVRLWVYWQKPFREAVNTPALHRAFDQLVGKGRWKPRDSLGTFVVRFPSPDDPGDTGWHIDASFPPPEFEGVPIEEMDFETTFVDWRVNLRSRGRALLMLFLFSDVGTQDAPTRIQVGLHLDVARMFEPFGEMGISAICCASATGVPKFWADIQQIAQREYLVDHRHSGRRENFPYAQQADR